VLRVESSTLRSCLRLVQRTPRTLSWPSSRQVPLEQAAASWELVLAAAQQAAVVVQANGR